MSKEEEKTQPSGQGDGTWTGWGWNMVESMGKTITTAIGYEDMEVVDPDSVDQTQNANGTAGWKNDTTLDRRNLDQSFWSKISQMIGSDVTSMLSVPVFLMEPTSVLQKMAEIMEYPDLLTKGAKATEDAERMAWAAAFGVSVYSSAERTWKPFNPILGETFQLKLGAGSPDEGEYLAEQVSHHPPIGAAHAETPYWSYDIVSCPKTKFLGNSLEVYPVGRTRIKYKTTNEELSLVPPTSKAYNLVLGKIWVDTFGDMTIENITSKWKTVLEFVPCGYFGAGRYTVKGNVFDPEGKPMLYIDGKWNDNLGFTQCDADGAPLAGAERTEMWKASEKPAGDPYGMTSFVKTHLNAWSGGALLSSDSRLRPDRAALEKGDSSSAQTHKHALEERQRAEKKKRTDDGAEWSPKWFKLDQDLALRDHEYSVEECPPWVFKRFPEASELAQIEADYHEGCDEKFSPWQYPEMEG